MTMYQRQVLERAAEAVFTMSLSHPGQHLSSRIASKVAVEAAKQSLKRHAGLYGAVRMLEQHSGVAAAPEAVIEKVALPWCREGNTDEGLLDEAVQGLGFHLPPRDTEMQLLAKTLICAELFGIKVYGVTLIADSGLTVEEGLEWVRAYVTGNPYEDGRDAVLAWAEKYDYEATPVLDEDRRHWRRVFPRDPEDVEACLPADHVRVFDYPVADGEWADAARRLRITLPAGVFDLAPGASLSESLSP